MAGKPATIRNMRTLSPMTPVQPKTEEEPKAAITETPPTEAPTPDEDPWAAAEAITETPPAPAAPAAAPVAASPAAPPVPPTSVPDYVAELADQRKRNRELTELILELNEKIDKLSTAKETQVTSKKLEISDKDIELSDAERQVYGESLPVIEKIVKKHLKEFGSQFDGQLKELANVTSKNDMAAFINSVQSKVTNARALTKDPAFVRYLSERVPGTGLSRKQIFDLAHENRDLEAVVSIFEGFNAEVPDATASMRGPSTTAANPQVTASTRLVQGKKPFFKESDSKRLSEDFRSGKIDLTVYKKRRALLEEAVREGRIIRGQ
jgi:hypothetical protein